MRTSGVERLRAAAEIDANGVPQSSEEGRDRTFVISSRSQTIKHFPMSTADQKLSAELRGEALLAAQRRELQPLIDHLREVAKGRDDIRTEVAGTIAGWWFASLDRQGHELIAAGLLMLAGGFGLAGSVAAD
jgi:hypothetical protein